MTPEQVGIQNFSPPTEDFTHVIRFGNALQQVKLNALYRNNNDNNLNSASSDLPTKPNFFHEPIRTINKHQNNMGYRRNPYNIHNIINVNPGNLGS